MPFLQDGTFSSWELLWRLFIRNRLSDHWLEECKAGQPTCSCELRYRYILSSCLHGMSFSNELMVPRFSGLAFPARCGELHKSFPVHGTEIVLRSRYRWCGRNTIQSDFKGDWVAERISDGRKDFRMLNYLLQVSGWNVFFDIHLEYPPWPARPGIPSDAALALCRPRATWQSCRCLPPQTHPA